MNLLHRGAFITLAFIHCVVLLLSGAFLNCVVFLGTLPVVVKQIIKAKSIKAPHVTMWNSSGSK